MAASGGATLDHLAAMYGEMLTQFPDEYAAYSLRDLALSHAQPLLSRALGDGWDPLRDYRVGPKMLAAWRPLLLADRSADAPFADDADPMTRLLTEPVIQPLRRALVSRWDPRDPEPALRFFEAWARVLPSAVVDDLHHAAILPKLQRATEAWDPTKDAVPIHAWLHPWLPRLGDAMRPLWAPIRHKLSNALSAWHPADGSALALLSPWRRVFDAKDWDALVVRSVLPKLQFALNELVVSRNPAPEDVEPLRWVLAWESAVPAARFVDALEDGFFPKWHACVHAWLAAGAADLEEVTRWYLGWKSEFGEELLARERIRRQLNIALDMMNRATAGEGVGAAPAEAARAAEKAARAAEKAAKAAEKAAKAPKDASASNRDDDDDGAEMSLREAVQAFAEANDVRFLPKPGRIAEGLQVYAFGKVSVTIDAAKEMLRAQTDGRWAPVSLDQLLERHKEKARAASKTF